MAQDLIKEVINTQSAIEEEKQDIEEVLVKVFLFSFSIFKD